MMKYLPGQYFVNPSIVDIQNPLVLVFTIPIKSTPMEASASADFLEYNQLPNRKKSLIDPFKALYPSPFISSINLLVKAAVDTNSKLYQIDFISSFPRWI